VRERWHQYLELAAEPPLEVAAQNGHDTGDNSDNGTH
jgi:hypothetical protein